MKTNDGPYKVVLLFFQFWRTEFFLILETIWAVFFRIMQFLAGKNNMINITTLILQLQLHDGFRKY